MPVAETAATGQSAVTLGCFQIGDYFVAIDVAQVREVVRWRPVTPLPKAPALIEGVIDLRDRLVPVVDLGRALASAPAQPGPDSRIAVVEVDGLAMGLVVEAAVDVIPVQASHLEDPPALAAQAGYEAARAVVRRPGEEPILVLSLEHILESVYRSALHPSEAHP